MVESRSMVNGASPGPAPAFQAQASNWRLTRVKLADVAPPEVAQEGAQSGRRLDRAAQGAGGPAGAQHVGGVDAVAAGQSLPRESGGRRPPGSSACRRCWPGLGHCLGRGTAGPVQTRQDAGPGWPEGAAQHWPPGGDRRRRCGCGRGRGVVAPSYRFRTLTRRPPSVDSG